jgi:hypothetical protein
MIMIVRPAHFVLVFPLFLFPMVGSWWFFFCDVLVLAGLGLHLLVANGGNLIDQDLASWLV